MSWRTRVRAPASASFFSFVFFFFFAPRFFFCWCFLLKYGISLWNSSCLSCTEGRVSGILSSRVWARVSCATRACPVSSAWCLFSFNLKHIICLVQTCTSTWYQTSLRATLDFVDVGSSPGKRYKRFSLPFFSFAFLLFFLTLFFFRVPYYLCI